MNDETKISSVELDEADELDKALTNEEFARYLGVHPSTIDHSRITGKLLGFDAPPYIKFGKSKNAPVRYLWPTAKGFKTKLSQHKFVHTSAYPNAET